MDRNPDLSELAAGSESLEEVNGAASHVDAIGEVHLLLGSWDTTEGVGVGCVHKALFTVHHLGGRRRGSRVCGSALMDVTRCVR